MTNEIKKRARGNFVLSCVEFSKIGKHDVTFIREMRVRVKFKVPEYGSRFLTTGPILGIYLGPGSQIQVQVSKYGSHRQEVGSILVEHFSFIAFCFCNQH